MTRRRVLLKVSGEFLSGDGRFGIDGEILAGLAQEIRDGLSPGDVELALVLGGGNFLRGKELATEGMDRATADHMGMLATTLNALAAQSALERIGMEVVVFSAFPIAGVAEPFAGREAVGRLEKGAVLILAGGTGHPFFTTDTAAVLRALQIGANFVLKATKVKGIFSADPETHPDAKFYPLLSFSEALKKDLKVMDATAFGLCRDNNLPIHVFSIKERGNVARALRGEHLGTLVT
jgi:uridylate kinase